MKESRKFKKQKGANKVFADVLKESKEIIKDNPRCINFSFRFLNVNHPKFKINDKQRKYFCSLLNKLRQYCTLTAIKLKNCRHKTVKCKPIKWQQTTEKGFGISHENEIVSQPYELNCTANKYGRIHGFFIDDTFNIVWLDPDHNLINSKSFKK